MVNIFLVDGDTVVLRASSIPEFETMIDRFRMRIGEEGINGWVAKSGEPLNVPMFSARTRGTGTRRTWRKS